jgi:hypothetical protein
MTAPYTFEIDVNQNEYLPAGGEIMDAVVSVRCGFDPGAATGPALSAAQVIVLDASASMSGTKIAEAKRATGIALDTLRDGVSFAIVAGATTAWMVYPKTEKLEIASARTRAQAKQALARLDIGNSTNIGSWLTLTNRLLVGARAQVRHAILLTDGYNNVGERQFPDIVASCRGNFVCDSRGVGQNWRAEPLLMIADTLQGSAEGLPDPAGLSDDFQAVTRAVMGTAAADVVLRVWTPADARIRLLKQSYPRITELTGTPSAAGARFTDHPIGQWGNETRHYHLRVAVPAGDVGDGRAAARVSVLVGDVRFTEQTVWIHWTTDVARSTRINQMVAEATGQSELAEAIKQGLDARKEGQADVATAKLARAVEIARRHGRDDTIKLLSKVVDIDKTTGTVRLRRTVAEFHAEMAMLDSRKTLRTNRD